MKLERMLRRLNVATGERLQYRLMLLQRDGVAGSLVTLVPLIVIMEHKCHDAVKPFGKAIMQSADEEPMELAIELGEEPRLVAMLARGLQVLNSKRFDLRPRGIVGSERRKLPDRVQFEQSTKAGKLATKRRIECAKPPATAGFALNQAVTSEADQEFPNGDRTDADPSREVGLGKMRSR